ncbi:hypothetical protein NSA23_00665 [Anaerosalibacter massiliensis]|uniref:Scaffolding protein n=1 Tax=Anaerosalibacter massiliensis TaxID=1347392 RepID=A0A9X2S611_9FIRM|nr:hypothetical protein [Anaerosalibacter massiliensis]MCR2042616.1 hypothetical protein [Anaerosalibacter massiliensis]
MEFEFEEKETYTLEEVKELVNQFQGQVEETITTKDTTIQELNEKVEGVEELDKRNKELSQKNLALKNGIDEEIIEFVVDEDLEKMQEKIDKFKELTKEKEIDESFKPEKKRNDDQYTKAEKEGNVQSMIGSKLERLFG